MKTIIHVNKQVIAANKKAGRLLRPALTVKNYKETRNAMAVRIYGPSLVVYRPHKPLHCGAVAWVETQAEVEILQ